jgi:hypothetical protein
MKRKAAKKLREKESVHQKKAEAGKANKTAMPVPALMMKILAVILSIIMVVALTLYVLGRMPARGFFVLTIILAVVAFIVMPAMRKKFS